MKSFLPFLKILVMLFVVAAAAQGVWSYTVDSEIWSVTLSQYLGQESHEYISLYNRLLFHTPLKVLYWFDFSNLEHLRAAKAIFAINGMVLCALALMLYQTLVGNSQVAWLGLLFLLCNPTWLAEFFRIRSDFLAMNFSLGALLVFLNEKRSDDFKKAAWIGLWILFSSLSTPKSILWNLPLLVVFAIGGDWKFNKPGKKSIQALAASFAVLAAVVTFNFTEILRSYFYAWKHFLESIEQYGPFDPEKYGVDWLFVYDSLYTSTLQWSVVFLCWFIAPFAKTRLAGRRKTALLLALWIFLGFFSFYSPKHAYLWAAMMPLLFIPYLLVSQWVYEKLKEIFKILWLVGLTVIFTFWFFNISRNHSGEEAENLIADLETLIAGKQVTVFDSMGLLPRVKNSMIYIGVGDSWSLEKAENELLEKLPELVLQTDRIRVFWPQFEAKVLDGMYDEIHEGIWVRKQTLEKPKGTFTLIGNTSSLFNQKLTSQLK